MPEFPDDLVLVLRCARAAPRDVHGAPLPQGVEEWLASQGITDEGQVEAVRDLLAVLEDERACWVEERMEAASQR